MQRLARLLRPHSGALVALALFLAAGLAVLDDYGLPKDGLIQRVIALYNIDYVLSTEADALELPEGVRPHDLFYGVAFEAPLALAERVFGLQGGRSIYFARHLLTHLYFLTGGLFAYLLASRLFRNRLLALAALLLFLLSPRLYAHSFFNSKDIPFLVTFMIMLFLAHRAFRKDALWSFALLGAGVGLLMNIRIMGVVLFAAVPAARSLDLLFAPGWEERKRAVVTIGVFALAGALTVYATMPHLWVNPVGQSIEWWTTLSSHPLVLWELLGGEPVVTSHLPARYLPVWFSITNIPAALLLGGIGALAVCGQAAARPRNLLRNTRLRFLAFIAACFAAPVLAVVLLSPNTYNGWRQTYFLYAPFSLLAIFGLQWLASAVRQRRLRAAVYSGAAIAASAAAVSLILLHPYQGSYFNVLVDRTTPERLRAQYDIDAWRAAPGLQGLRLLLQEHPAETIPVNGLLRRNAQLLPELARGRIVGVGEFRSLPSGRFSWRLEHRRSRQPFAYSSNA